MTEPSFVGELVLLIAIAAVAAALFARLRLPAVAGFLVIGAAVGPGGLGLVDDVDRVRAIAELGVVFLLFQIGLELPVERVRRLWRRAAAAGALQILLTVSGVAALAIALEVPPGRAIILGGIVAMSSTALVMRVLSSRGEIDAPQGQLSVGILLFQDLCIVPFLLAVPLLATQGSGPSSTALLSLVRVAAALVIFFVVARFALPRLLDRVAALGSPELFSLVAFLVVLGSAWTAEELGLTLAVGAFVGGLVLSASPYTHQIFAEMVPLRGVLIGLFFTAVGMLLDVKIALQGWPAVLIYVSAVVVLKTAIVTAIVALALRQSLRLGIVTGLGLAQTGEFSFVLAEVSSEAGLLDATLHQVFVAGSIATLMATPLLMRIAPVIARLLLGERSAAAEPPSGEGRRGHVVLLGFGLAGQTLARVLRARGIGYVGADANPSAVRQLSAGGEQVIYGDVTGRVLIERMDVSAARLVGRHHL